MAMQKIMALFNWSCLEWEGGNKWYSGVCTACEDNTTMNPWYKWSKNIYSICSQDECSTPGFVIEDSYCIIGCGNGTRNDDFYLDQTCTCNDSWKTWGTSGWGCTCPSTKPVEDQATSSCSAPSTSDTVIELEMDGQQIEFWTGTTSTSVLVFYGYDPVQTPSCADYSPWRSNDKYVCTAPKCDEGFFLYIYVGGQLVCFHNIYENTVDSNGWITNCSTDSPWPDNVLALKLAYSPYYFTSCISQPRFSTAVDMTLIDTNKWVLVITHYPTVIVTEITAAAQFNGLTDCSVTKCYTDYF